MDEWNKILITNFTDDMYYNSEEKSFEINLDSESAL